VHLFFNENEAEDMSCSRGKGPVKYRDRVSSPPLKIVIEGDFNRGLQSGGEYDWYRSDPKTGPTPKSGPGGPKVYRI
jgi:hypothetical protein